MYMCFSNRDVLFISLLLASGRLSYSREQVKKRKEKSRLCCKNNRNQIMLLLRIPQQEPLAARRVQQSEDNNLLGWKRRGHLEPTNMASSCHPDRQQSPSAWRAGHTRQPAPWGLSINSTQRLPPPPRHLLSKSGGQMHTRGVRNEEVVGEERASPKPCSCVLSDSIVHSYCLPECCKPPPSQPCHTIRGCSNQFTLLKRWAAPRGRSQDFIVQNPAG